MSSLAKVFRFSVWLAAGTAFCAGAILAGLVVGAAAIFTDGLVYFLGALLFVEASLFAAVMWAERELPPPEICGAVAAIVIMLLVAAAVVLL